MLFLSSITTSSDLSKACLSSSRFWSEKYAAMTLQIEDHEVANRSLELVRAIVVLLLVVTFQGATIYIMVSGLL